MPVNRYLPFALVYFFINSVGLPFGLTYTALLTPLFYGWILYQRKRDVLMPFLLIILPFIVVQYFVVGVDGKAYLVSLVNILLVYVFCQAVFTFLVNCHNPEKILRLLLIVNFVLCLIAIPFYFSGQFEWFWVEQTISTGVGEMRRLKMFTYEPSYYAMIFTPVFFFFFLQYLLKQNTIKTVWLLPMLFLPYLLSFSIGVMGAVVLAIILTWLFWFRSLTGKKRVFNTIVNLGFLLFAVLCTVFIFFRNNQLFARMTNIFSGEDSSGNGRTVDAFILANKMIQEKSEYWGVGLGQIKVMGNDIIRDYYMYYMDYAAAIPNAAAETLAIFGWVGFCLRMLIEVFLFIYTRVWTNYYRLVLFFFVFIYQFTGSFITNIAEYVIWIIAFTNVFPRFDVKPKSRVDLSSYQV